jgi:hypothetical protein
MTLYPFDPTGSATTNHIVNEPHRVHENQTTGAGGSYYVLIPKQAPFFLESLSIYRNNETKPLVEGRDYSLGFPFMLGQYLLGHPMYGAILFDPDVADADIHITYNSIGGSWVTLDAALPNPQPGTLLSNYDGVTTAYDGIPEIPYTNDSYLFGGDPTTLYSGLMPEIIANDYNPRLTLWETLLTSFPDFKKDNYGKYSRNDVPFSALISVIKEFQQDFINPPDQSAFISHLTDYANPHGVNTKQIHLDLLENLPPVSDAEVAAKTSVRKYVTLKQTLNLVGYVGGTPAGENSITVEGPLTVYEGVQQAYVLTDFDSRTVYTVAPLGGAGTVEVIDDTIIYNAPLATGTYGFSVNGQNFPVGVMAGGVTLAKGPTSRPAIIGTILHAFTLTPNSFWIYNYDSRFQYSVSFSGGTVTRDGKYITIYPSAPQGTYRLTINGRVIMVTLSQSHVDKATIISPTMDQATRLSVTLDVSPFSSFGYQDTQLSTTWQVATDSAFTNIVASSVNDTVNLTSWTVTGLLDKTTYYARAKLTGTVLGDGAWSDYVRFNANYYAVPSAVIQSINPDNFSNQNYEFTSIRPVFKQDKSGFVIGANTNSLNFYKLNGNTFILTNTATVMASCTDGCRARNADILAVVGSNGSNVLNIYSIANDTLTLLKSIPLSNVEAPVQNYTKLCISDDGLSIVIAYSIANVTLPYQGIVVSYQATSIAAADWTKVATITEPVPVQYGYFGSRLYLSGDGQTMIIGSVTPDASTSVSNFYVFTALGNSWNFQSNFKNNGYESLIDKPAGMITPDGNYFITGCKQQGILPTFNGNTNVSIDLPVVSIYSLVNGQATLVRTYYVDFPQTNYMFYRLAIATDHTGKIFFFQVAGDTTSDTGNALSKIYAFMSTDGNKTWSIVDDYIENNQGNYFSYDHLAATDDGAMVIRALMDTSYGAQNQLEVYA